jgi:hypothetical protein
MVFVVEKVALWRLFSGHFDFSCQFSFHQLLYSCHVVPALSASLNTQHRKRKPLLFWGSIPDMLIISVQLYFLNSFFIFFSVFKFYLVLFFSFCYTSAALFKAIGFCFTPPPLVRS